MCADPDISSRFIFVVVVNKKIGDIHLVWPIGQLANVVEHTDILFSIIVMHIWLEYVQNRNL